MKKPAGFGPDDALRMRAVYDELTPLIEAHTRRVCPGCKSVCCIDRHAYPEREDMAFWDALGIQPPEVLERELDTMPCRYLNEFGCSIERWQRPYRCTWYFCGDFLNDMKANAKPRQYRRMTDLLSELTAFRSLIAKTHGW